MKMTRNQEIEALKIIIKSTEKFIKEAKKEFSNEEAQKALSHIQYHLEAVTNAQFHQTSLP